MTPLNPSPLRASAHTLALLAALTAPTLAQAQSAPSGSSSTDALPAAPSPVESPTTAAPVAAQPPTSAPVLDPETAEAVAREPLIRSSCRDALGVDYFMWVSAAGLIAAGTTLAIVGLTTPATTPPSLLVRFAVGLGPGLVLGGVGVPFARGVIDAPDPLRTMCRRLQRTATGHADPHDLEAIDRLMIAGGRPDTAVLPILLGIATAGTAAFAAIAIASNNADLTQLSGGIAAAVVTGWFLIPHAPARAAALAYARRMNAFTPAEPIGGVVTPVAFGVPGRGLAAGLRYTF